MEKIDTHSASRKSIALSFYTLASRLLGLVRDHYMAISFGNGMLASAFSVAYRLPNMYRNLLAEGTLSQSFMPIYSDSTKESNLEAKKMSGSVLSFLTCFLFIFIGVFILTAPYFLPYLVGGSLEYIQTVIDLSSILFFLIFTASLSSIYIAIANTQNKFFVPSLSPIILNLSYLFVFIVLFKYVEDTESRIKILCYGIITGGFLQLLTQAFYIRKLKLSPQWNFNYKHPAIKKILTLMLPAVIGGGFYQISLLVDIFLANYIQNQNPGLGAVVSLDYSQRLIQLPTGIIGVALATTTLPSLLNSLKKEEYETIPKNLINTLSFSVYITIPAAIGFLLLGEEIIDAIYFGGKWDKKATLTTIAALQFYSIAIPAYSMNKILTSSYYAFKDTKTPLKINMISFSINIVFNLILMNHFKHAGLALSSTVSANLTFLLLIYFFKKHNIKLSFRTFLYKIQSFILPILGLILWIFMIKYFRNSIYIELGELNHETKQRILCLVGILPSGVLYFIISYLNKVEEFEIIFGKLLKRFNSK